MSNKECPMSKGDLSLATHYDYYDWTTTILKSSAYLDIPYWILDIP